MSRSHGADGGTASEGDEPAARPPSRVAAQTARSGSASDLEGVREVTLAAAAPAPGDLADADPTAVRARPIEQHPVQRRRRVQPAAARRTEEPMDRARHADVGRDRSHRRIGTGELPLDGTLPPHQRGRGRADPGGVPPHEGCHAGTPRRVTRSDRPSHAVRSRPSGADQARRRRLDLSGRPGRRPSVRRLERKSRHGRRGSDGLAPGAAPLTGRSTALPPTSCGFAVTQPSASSSRSSRRPGARYRPRGPARRAGAWTGRG